MTAIRSKHLTFIRLALWLAAALLTSCATVVDPQTGPRDSAACLPSFPLKDGWLGGDAAYSIELPDATTLWFFGDTFVAIDDAVNRSTAGFVANSSARSTCRNGQWQITYFWKIGADGARPIFQPREKHLIHWPLASFLHDGRLYLFLSRVRRVTPEPLGFKTVGVDMAVIQNPATPPDTWQPVIRPVYRGEDALPGVAAIKQEHFVYLYTSLVGPDTPNHPIILTRLALDALDKPKQALQYYAPGGYWRSGLNRNEAIRVMKTGATEMSIRYHEPSNRYLAVMTSPTPFADHAELRIGRTIAGPWQKPQKLFDYDEQVKAREAGNLNVFCYASKEHPQFGRGNRILVTYACNSLDDQILNDTSLYVPQAKRIALPQK